MPACPSVTRGTRDRLMGEVDLGRGAGGTIGGKTTRRIKITYQRQPRCLPRRGMLVAAPGWSGITTIPPVLFIGT